MENNIKAYLLFDLVHGRKHRLIMQCIIFITRKVSIQKNSFDSHYLFELWLTMTIEIDIELGEFSMHTCFPEPMTCV